MKTALYCLTIVASLQLFTVNYCAAQTTETLQAKPAHLNIDGDAKEWGDSLRYYNPHLKLNYAITNDADNLYVAIRVYDRSQQTRVLKAGFTFTVDPKGKKRDSYSITFPLRLSAEKQVPVFDKGDDVEITQRDRDELLREEATTLRGIKVNGFKDIEGDMITTANTYGIKAAVNYDQKGNLVCEAAIPLSFFHAEGAYNNEWAFNFKINGISRASENPIGGQNSGLSTGGRGGRGGGMGGGGRGGRGGRSNNGLNNQSSDTGHSLLSKSEDFWEKFFLAKQVR